MTLKTSFKKAFACLCACVLMLYSVLTSFAFRVHGAFSDFSFPVAIDGLIDYIYTNTRNTLEHFPVDTSIPLYILDAGYAIFGSDGMADNALNLYDDLTNSGNKVVIDTATSTGWSGYYERNGSVHSVSLFTRDVSTYDASKNIMLISTDDYFLSLKILPTSGHGYEDYTFTLSMSVNGGGYGPSSGSFAYKLTSQNNSMTFIPQITLYSNGDTLTKTYSNGVYQFEQWIFVSNSSSPYVLPDDPSTLIDHLSPSSVSSTSTIRNQTTICSFNKRYPSNQSSRTWPTGNTQTLSYDNIENTYNYYNQYATPYLQNIVGDTFTVYNVDYYSEIVQENLPVETTSPGSGVIIIDPFTLPPEWVQSDVVELETDHYTVPYEDMIDDPFDYLAGLGTYPNPPTPALNARKRSETSTVTRAVSVDEGSPPLIWDMADYETKTALTDYFLFAENLLHDTGLYNLVGSLIAVGIIVSLV